MITVDQLKKITPKGKIDILTKVAEYFNEYCDEYGVNTPLRLSHFFAQAAHESAGFQTLVEYGGDAYHNKMYDTRTDLGNTAARDGDGAKYKGRGIFQLTGKANYKKFGDILGVDLVNNPDLAATPEISVRTALEYWKSRGLNALADSDDVRAITKKINGGYNGFDDRVEYLERAKETFRIIPKTGNSSQVRYVQELLIALNYKIQADDIKGPRTNAAIRLFRRLNGLPVNEEIDADLIKELEKQADR